MYIGIDLGTSAVKLLLVSPEGDVRKSVSRAYPVSYPHPGWSEQDPEQWFSAVCDGLNELTEGIDRASVRGLGCAGQMHGLVALDENDRVIRPAILWNDGRTQEETDELNADRALLSGETGNVAFAGFTAPKVLWMQKHEPEAFGRIKHVMLPKDYINFRLTGAYSTDYSDASGTLWLDVKNKRWSKIMLDKCGLTEDTVMPLFESRQVVGRVKPEFGFPNACVVAGAGDNAAAAVGTGTVGEGTCTVSLGTSGTIFIPSASFRVDPENALHSFAHADGGFHLMGCTLSAASCWDWVCRKVLENDDLAGEEKRIAKDAPGNNDVYFLPYLMGERSPVNDALARGTFVGLTPSSTRSDLSLAVLEGVAFAIRDSLEVARRQGLAPKSSFICGGGAKSPLWRKIFASVLDLPLTRPACEEGPGYGAALLAMVGDGAFPTVKDAVRSLARPGTVTEPDPVWTLRYEERYHRFTKIYPAMRSLFRELAEK